MSEPSLLNLVEESIFRQQLLSHHSASYPTELLEALINHYGLYTADALLNRTHESFYSPHHQKNLEPEERAQVIDQYLQDYFRCRVLLNVCDAWVERDKSWEDNRATYQAFWEDWWEVTKKYKTIKHQEMRQKFPKPPEEGQEDKYGPPFYGFKEWTREQKVKDDIKLWLKGEIHSLRPPPRVTMEEPQVKLEYTPMVMKEEEPNYSHEPVAEASGGWGMDEDTAAVPRDVAMTAPTAPLEATSVAQGASDWD